MATINDDEPAFPRSGHECQPQSGMTLRDYFASKALCGMLSDQRDGSYVNTREPEQIAATAYKLADAMLAERAKEQGQ